LTNKGWGKGRNKTEVDRVDKQYGGGGNIYELKRRTMGGTSYQKKKKPPTNGGSRNRKGKGRAWQKIKDRVYVRRD